MKIINKILKLLSQKTRFKDLKDGTYVRIKMKEGSDFPMDLGYGVIRKVGKDIFLCQDEKDGLTVPNTYGFKFSYYISGYTVKEVTILPFLTFEREYRNYKYFLEQIERFKKVVRYPLSIKQDNLIFGCGDVTLTEKELEGVINTFEILKNYEIDADEITPFIKTLKYIKRIIKNDF